MASQSSIDLAQQMFVVYYGRPADAGGLSFYADRLASGEATLASIGSDALIDYLAI